jgi:CIC family chloride channel protein
MLPLLVACLAAYATADTLGDLPIYERLLDRDLSRGTGRAELPSPLLLDLSIQPGAALDGKEVRDLGLASGCVLVSVRRGRTEQVPTPEMRLGAGDRLVVLIAPAAAGAMGALREAAQHARRG